MNNAIDGKAKSIVEVGHDVPVDIADGRVVTPQDDSKDVTDEEGEKVGDTSYYVHTKNCSLITKRGTHTH